MSQLTLANVSTFVRASIPNYPQAKIGTFANLVLEEVYERLNQINYGTFTTTAPYTTGTANVGNNSAAIVFSGSALGASDPLRLVQVGDDPTYYIVTRTNATTGVLSSVYAGTTNATATFKIVYPTVVFPAAVGVPLAIKREGFGRLEFGPASDLNARLRGNTTGQPMYYSPYAMDGAATPDDAHRILLTPYPDAMYSYAYEYLARPTLIDPDTVTPTTEKVPIPTSFRSALLFGTMALCAEAEDKDGDKWAMKAEMAFRKALAHSGAGTTGQRRGAYGHRRQMYAVQETPSE